MSLEINLYGIVLSHYNSDSLSFQIKFNHQKCLTPKPFYPRGTWFIVLKYTENVYPFNQADYSEYYHAPTTSGIY